MAWKEKGELQVQGAMLLRLATVDVLHALSGPLTHAALRRMVRYVRGR